jgi:hypothetical protein
VTSPAAVWNAVLSTGDPGAAEPPEGGWGQTKLRVVGEIGPLATSICPEALFESLVIARGILATLQEHRKATRVPPDARKEVGEGLQAAIEATAVSATAAVPTPLGGDVDWAGLGDAGELRSLAVEGGSEAVKVNVGQASAMEQQPSEDFACYNNLMVLSVLWCPTLKEP